MVAPYDATQQTDPDDYLDKLRDTEVESKRIQRQFGAAGGAAPVGMSYDAKRQGLNKFITGDLDRRTTALAGAAELAKSTDTRRTEIDGASTAVDAKNKFLNQDSLTSQSNMLRENQLGRDTLAENVNQQGQKIAFSALKTQAERDDAIISAIQKGELEQEMLSSAQTHGIGMQDIDTMFDKLIADIDNQYKDWEMEAKGDNAALIKRWELQANNTAAVVNGTTQAVGTAAEAFKPPKTAPTPGTPQAGTPTSRSNVA